MNRTLAIAAILIALPLAAFAQEAPPAQDPAPKSETLVVKATIEAIDHDTRTITLKDKEGMYETIYAGPEVKRFNELKVGDKVTFRYTESVVFKIRKPGEAAAASAVGEPTLERGAGPKPSGKVSMQETSTVLIKAIDEKAPAVTVQDEDGRTLSFKVEDKGLLRSVKAGDRVEITYNTALAISVE
jgi:Cu/Ag efflux protein CusF